jgi:hypothetical protein
VWWSVCGKAKCKGTPKGNSLLHDMVRVFVVGVGMTKFEKPGGKVMRLMGFYSLRGVN